MPALVQTVSLAALTAILVCAVPATISDVQTADAAQAPGQPIYSLYTGHNYPSYSLRGDQHLHTSEPQQARHVPGNHRLRVALHFGGGNNLQRNVICRDAGELSDKVRPVTTFDTEIPHQPRKGMAVYEQETDGRLMAIPHDGNRSKRLMFATETPDGTPVDATWAATRQRRKALYEVTHA